MTTKMRPELSNHLTEKDRKTNQQAYEVHLDEYQKELLNWQKNVDQRYAWVVLAALWLALFGTFGPLRAFGLIFVRTTTEGGYTREDASWPISTILTVNNLLGPLVPLITHYITVRQNIVLAGVLLVLGNVLTVFSDNLWLDILFLGVVQGTGMALLLMPVMGIINSYFIRYRTMAFGLAHTGSTLSVLAISPLTQWILEQYPWRYAYLGTGAFGCLVLVVSPLLTPNTKPQPPAELCSNKPVAMEGSLDEQVVVEVERKGSSKVAAILKKPAFHIVWLHIIVYYWVFGIFGIVLVDYGADRGLTSDEADSLLDFQMLGELIGRLLLAIPVDMQLISAKWALIVDLFSQAAALTLLTQLNGYYWLAAITLALNAFMSFSYILLNNLIIQHFGERQVTLAYSMASFICGLLIFFRPQAVGYFRDYLGSYDPLMLCLSLATVVVATLWLIEPLFPCKSREPRTKTQDSKQGSDYDP